MSPSTKRNGVARTHPALVIRCYGSPASMKACSTIGVSGPDRRGHRAHVLHRHPGVDVTERSGDPVESDLERPRDEPTARWQHHGFALDPHRVE